MAAEAAVIEASEGMATSARIRRNLINRDCFIGVLRKRFWGFYFRLSTVEIYDLQSFFARIFH